jgi:hypothetical protein
MQILLLFLMLIYIYIVGNMYRWWLTPTYIDTTLILFILFIILCRICVNTILLGWVYYIVLFQD